MLDRFSLSDYIPRALPDENGRWFLDNVLGAMFSQAPTMGLLETYLSADAAAGSTTITLHDITEEIYVGNSILVSTTTRSNVYSTAQATQGPGTSVSTVSYEEHAPEVLEVRQITAINGFVITLDSGLTYDHTKNDSVFIKYNETRLHSFLLEDADAASQSLRGALPNSDYFLSTYAHYSVITSTILSMTAQSSTPSNGPSTFTRGTTASYIDPVSGLIKTSAINEIRYERASDGIIRKLLELASTNELTYSEQIDNAIWLKTASTVTANAVVAPDGNTTADKVIEDTTATSTHNVQQAYTFTPSTTYTFSCFAQAAERTACEVNIYDGVTSHSALFDLTTGVVGYSGTGVTAKSVALTNNWYRLEITATVDSGAGAGNVAILLSTSSTSTAGVTYTGDGTSGIYVWGAQLEALDIPTSYIPTIASAATRDADTFTLPSTGFVSGNFDISVDAQIALGSSQPEGRIFDITFTGSDIRTSGGTSYSVVAAGTNDLYVNLDAADYGAVHTYEFTYDGTTFSVLVDGVLKASAAATLDLSLATGISVGTYGGQQGRLLFGDFTYTNTANTLDYYDLPVDSTLFSETPNPMTIDVEYIDPRYPTWVDMALDHDFEFIIGTGGTGNTLRVYNNSTTSKPGTLSYPVEFRLLKVYYKAIVPTEIEMNNTTLKELISQGDYYRTYDTDVVFDSNNNWVSGLPSASPGLMSIADNILDCYDIDTSLDNAQQSALAELVAIYNDMEKLPAPLRNLVAASRTIWSTAGSPGLLKSMATMLGYQSVMVDDEYALQTAPGLEQFEPFFENQSYSPSFNFFWSLFGFVDNSPSIVKITTAGWGNAGAYTTDTISGDGTFKFTIGGTGAATVGLLTAHIDYTPSTLDYAVNLNADGTIDLYEGATAIYTGIGTYSPGDTISLTWMGTTLYAYKNDTTLLHSFNTPISGTYILEAQINSTAMSIVDIYYIDIYGTENYVTFAGNTGVQVGYSVLGKNLIPYLPSGFFTAATLGGSYGDSEFALAGFGTGGTTQNSVWLLQDVQRAYAYFYRSPSVLNPIIYESIIDILENEYVYDGRDLIPLSFFDIIVDAPVNTILEDSVSSAALYNIVNFTKPFTRYLNNLIARRRVSDILNTAITDALAVNGTKVLNEYAITAISETLTKAFSRPLSDSISSPTDSWNKDFIKALTESSTSSESTSMDFVKGAISESTTPLDAIAALISKTYAESSTPVESIARTIVKTYAEALTISDSHTINTTSPLSESSTSTDSMTLAIEKALSDSMSTTETFLPLIASGASINGAALNMHPLN